MGEQGISLEMSSFSSEIFGKTIAYKKQKEEDRCMREQGVSLVMSSFSSEIEDYSIQEGGVREQGISLVMSSFSSEIEDYSIQEAEGGGQKHEGARHITGNVLILLRN